MATGNAPIPVIGPEFRRCARACCDHVATHRRVRDRILLARISLRAAPNIRGNRLEKRAVKNNKWIRLELPSAVVEALDLLPAPKAAAGSGQWTLYSNFGVEGAHPHRFRHTLASELLGKGGSIEKVAGILGDKSPDDQRVLCEVDAGVSAGST